MEPRKDTEGRFNWDAPRQGMFYHRTLEGAFGPGTRLHTNQPTITKDALAYAVAAALVVATIVIA
jgi:hypothetical protein